tara:strand:- start:263 stop:475 length:213 start_codon:yes stop_codon:yes gene_type:complete
MKPDYATAEDFATWREHAKSCDIPALRHIIKDCHNAARAMADHNVQKEGFYIDQALTYSEELRNRYSHNI